MIHIRSSTENDIAAIARIYGHYVLHSSATFEIDPPGEEEIGRRRAEILELQMPYLVAEREGMVVGYTYAGPYRPRPAYRFTLEDSIYLDPQYLGLGCGSALLGRLIEDCQRGPWRQMVAVIGGSENHASVRLHQRFGFRKAGVLGSVGFKFDQWVDTLLMQRELGRPLQR